MKRIFFLLTSLAISEALQAQVIDKPAATVNLTKPDYVSVDQLNTRVEQFETLRRQNGLAIPANDKSQVLDSMIDEILLTQAAARDGVTVSQSDLDNTVAQIKRSFEGQVGPLTDDQFHSFMEQRTGMSWDQYLSQVDSQIIQQRYVMLKKGSEINGVPTPTEQQIEDRYGQIANQLTNPEIVRFSQVFIDTRNLKPAEKEKARERADEAYREYLNGEETFDQLVAEYSDDPRNRYTGGDFGYLLRDDQRAVRIFGQSFVDQVFALHVGDVKGVIESDIGFHIVKITEHYPPRLLGLGDYTFPNSKVTVHDYISNMILQEEKNQAFQQAEADLVDSLKKQADITIFQQNLN